MTTSPLADLVHQTSLTTGTGNLTLSAVNGKVTFDIAFGHGATTNVFFYFVMNRNAAEWERGVGHMSDATTLVRDTVIASSNANALVSFSSGTLDVANDMPARLQLPEPMLGLNMPSNLGLAQSVGSSALTISLKGADGNDPSPSNPVYVPFRNATIATGTPVWQRAVASNSLTISSGSLMGASNLTPFSLWIVIFDDAGTLRLGAVNCLMSSGIFPLDESGVASSTAEGGAGAADSAGVIYTGTAVSSKSYRIIGRITYESGLTTAGTWSAVGTTLSLFGPGMKKPGDVVQRQYSETGAMSTTATAIPYDDTIPQNTEGAQFMSATITPASAANILVTDVVANVSNAGASGVCSVALFQDSVANALAATSVQNNVGSGSNSPLALSHTQLAAGTAPTTFKVRAGPNTSTLTFNGVSGGRLFGGVYNSSIEITELMG